MIHSVTYGEPMDEDDETLPLALSGDNSDLVAAAYKLYVNPVLDTIVDLTYGEGVWWRKCYHDDRLITKHDKYKLDGVDYTQKLPHPPNSIDHVWFDPPYVAKGGRETSGIREMDDAYGLHEAATDPETMMQNVFTGMVRAWHIVRPGGLLWVKSMDYVSSGKYVPATFSVQDFAFRMFRMQKVTIQDQLLLVRKAPGPQPTTNRDGSKRRQVHTHRVHSTLTLFRKGNA